MDIMKAEANMELQTDCPPEPGEDMLDWIARWYNHQISLLDNSIEMTKNSGLGEELDGLVEFFESKKTELEEQAEKFHSEEVKEEFRRKTDAFRKLGNVV